MCCMMIYDDNVWRIPWGTDAGSYLERAKLEIVPDEKLMGTAVNHHALMAVCCSFLLLQVGFLSGDSPAKQSPNDNDSNRGDDAV